MKPRRGEGTLILVVLLAAVAAYALPKPKFLSGESRRAEASKEATAEVVAAVEEVKKAEEAKGAKVAASLQQIGVANTDAPDSPQKDFIGREISHVSPLLPPPDYEALLAAEQRRLAVTQGRLELADQLYNKASKENEKLLRQVEKLEQDYQRAVALRREADMRLSEAAAAVRAREQVIGGLLGICVLLGVLYFVAKVNGVSLRSLAVAAADIRGGEQPIQALDRILTLSQQRKVSRLADPSK